MLYKATASALADLQMHWDSAYDIGYDSFNDLWWAQWSGALAEFQLSPALTADSASTLRQLIREDYAGRTLPKPPVGPDSFANLSERMSV